MPRQRRPDAPEPKKRSRTGCWNCKRRKMKCGEEKPKCTNCVERSEQCDYSIKLNWEHGKGQPGDEDHVKDSLVAFTAQPTKMDPETESTSKTPRVDGKATPDLSSKYTPTLTQEPHSSHTDGERRSHEPSPREPRQPHIGPTLAPIHKAADASPLPSLTSPGTLSRSSSGQMPPPFQPVSYKNAKRQQMDSVVQYPYSPANPLPALKRHRTTGSESLGTQTHSLSATSSPDGGISTGHHYSTSIDNFSNPGTSPSDYLNTPISSSYSRDGTPYLNKHLAQVNQSNLLSPSTNLENDPRRMSVNSLLIAEEQEHNTFGRNRKDSDLDKHYGVDRGLPDRDIPYNDDSNSLTVPTPSSLSSSLAIGEDDQTFEFGFGVTVKGQQSLPTSRAPLEVILPRSLVLPPLLLENPMNLLYFHHFYVYVARILVPHDCAENPFRLILPQMAVRDDNLLCLLLAYSASHRAGLLNYRPPTKRIAGFIHNVFRALSDAIANPTNVSQTTVATAIMLASMQIVAPEAFGSGVTWKQNLDLARTIIVSKSGAITVARNGRDRVSYFLIRWFAYLDLIGKLMSGVGRDQPAIVDSDYWNLESDGADSQIDCLLGFTTQLVGVLSKIANLAQTCDQLRIDTMNRVNERWQPSNEVQAHGYALLAALDRIQGQGFQGCPHADHIKGEEGMLQEIEMVETNSAFHHAAKLHVYKRILGKKSSDVEVKKSAREVMKCLMKIREGGTAEGCVVFALFTAGCELTEEWQRDIVLRRIKMVEKNGMTQVRKAREIMEKVWTTGQPWETLVDGQFFG